MMTEMEKLKHEADMSLVRTKLGDISKYLEELADECFKREAWTYRCDSLEFFVLSVYFFNMFLCSWLKSGETITRVSLDFIFLIFLFVLLRSWYHAKRWREKEGEWTGAITVLRKLGMMPPEHDGDNRKKIKTKRKALFPRFKEFVERMKAKNPMEAYA